MYISFIFVLFLGIEIQYVHCTCGDRTPVVLEPYQKTTIRSPVTSDGTYAPNSTCSWIIQRSMDVPPEMRLLVHIEETEMQCPGDYVRLHLDINEFGPRIFDEFKCSPFANRSETQVIPASAFVEFNSNEDDQTGGGFAMTFIPANDMSGEGCLSTASLMADDKEQYITSPSFPDDSPLSSDCSWNITDKGNNSVEVIVYFLRLNNDNNCDNHQLEITTNEGVTFLCGLKLENTVFQSNEISIRFTTDAVSKAKGFLIGYKSIMAPTTTTATDPSSSTTTASTDTTTDLLSTATPTLSPDYYGWMYPDYNKPVPDYYYYDWWTGGNPYVTDVPWGGYKTVQTSSAAPETTTASGTTEATTQKSLWDTLFPNWLYFNYFF